MVVVVFRLTWAGPGGWCGSCSLLDGSCSFLDLLGRGREDGVLVVVC